MPNKEHESQDTNENPIARILALRREVLENPQSAEALCDLGVAMIQSGDPKSAIVYFKRSLQIDKNHERSYYNLGICYHKIGFIDNAISAYESVIRINPKDDQTWSNLASLFFQRNELKEAIEFYQKALEINPDSPETWFSLSSALYQAGDYDQSIQAAEKAIERDNSQHIYWLQLGQGFYALHDHQNSVRALLQATELNSQSEKSWNNLGNAYLLGNQYDEAEAAYRKAININSNNTDYWFNLGELLFQLGSFLEATSCFTKVITENPEDSETLEYLAKALLKTSPAEAASRLKSLIRIRGEQPEYLNMLAQAYQNSGKPDLEAKTRLKLASSKPMDSENNHALAKLLLKQGKRDLAYSFFKDSRPLADREPEIWYLFAQSFRLENRLEEEFQCLTSAVKANPSHLQSWLRLGSIAIQNEINSNALQFLEKAGALLKNDTNLWLSTCERCLDQGKPNLAFQCAFKLIDLVEYAPKIWESLCKQFHKAKKTAELFEALTGYLTTNACKPEINAAFGSLIYQQGHQEQALTFLKDRQALNPTEPILTSQLCRLYLQSGQPEAACELVAEESVSQSRNYDLLVVLAESLYHLNRIEEADDALVKAHEIRQDHYKSWYLWGIIHHRKGILNQALEYLDKSLSLYKGDEKVWYAKGNLLESQRQPYEAEQAYQKAVRLNRRHSKSWQGLASLQAANGDDKTARFLLLRSLAADRDNREAWQMLGKLFGRLGETDKSASCQQQAEQLQITNKPAPTVDE